MPFRFESPAWLLVGLGVAVAVCAIVAWCRRRPGLPRRSLAFGAAGLLLWSLALGGMIWRRGARSEIVVMVDCSPSTRTATYRQRATLDRRLHELLGDVPRRILLFADGNTPDTGQGPALPDLPAERTTFSPPPTAAAILLFGDGQFDPPARAPPTYPVIDPNLESPADAAVKRLTIREGELVADVSVTGSPRPLTLHGVAATQPMRIDSGSFAITGSVPPGTMRAGAEFSPGDAWPENDVLWTRLPPPAQRERWWVGPAPPAEWRSFNADALPASSSDYLSPAVIVLNNIAADALSPTAQQRLSAYVGQLGGGLVILGGDRAFAAGGYEGTSLESLSPLASVPPEPATRWIVLVDGSGSMAGATPGDGSQWEAAGRAVAALLPRLPQADTISVGSFADQVTWWANGKPAREIAAMALPPANVSPHGPTNLQRALDDITRATDGTMPTELLLVTDAETNLDRLDELASAMQGRHVHLGILAIGNGSGLPALRHLAQSTGGNVIAVPDAAAWSAGLRDLARGETSRWLETSPLVVTFRPPLHLATRAAAPWNRVWIKPAAEFLAVGNAAGATTQPLARWQAGTGRVIAAAFVATPAEAEAMAALVAAPPSDPRFTVKWDAGPQLTVEVDAVDGRTYLNDQSLSLELLRDGRPPSTTPIPQVAPGRYRIAIDAPRTSCIASVRQAGRVLSQTAVAGRYPPEFDAIGNNHAAMHELADRSGGQVIDARRISPIPFRWPSRDIFLPPWLAVAGGISFAASLILWRRS